MTNPATSEAYRDQAWAVLALDGTPVSVIRDSPGFVAQRVLAQIVNIGCEIAQQAIATPADIDMAVKLGLGYPKGPLEFGEAFGPDKILYILDAIQETTGDPRYRAALWLRRRSTGLIGMHQDELSAP
jgi:3-hydroxybutyryl-CoA dehydrogenase